jgi:uncharacterized protein YbaR (Trm112 family)
MKIWLNHTLACPDDASYPLNLLIFKWESAEDQFKALLDAYRANALYNFRNEESPLAIEKIESATEKEIISKNMQQLQENSSIIHLVKQNDGIHFYDTNVIDPLPLREYIKSYLDILEEFSIIFDHSKSKPVNEALYVVTHTIYPKMRSIFSKIAKNLNDIKNVEEIISPIFQDLIFLNIFLTYLEIEEGLLVCTHCKRWYPIIKTIPRIYPKTMKRQEMDIEFRNKWSELYPDDVVKD